MVFDLEAVPAGWIVRVLPAAGQRPAHDAAELATPPYNSVTPLAITTDFSFRAQDAVAWNPRRFQFAAEMSSFKKLQSVYTAFMAKPDDAAAGERLAEMAAASATGELQILDARLVPGTANQSQMAAAVASHIAQTPHTVEQGGSPLGAITWLKFRVTVHLPAGFAAAKGLKSGEVPGLPVGWLGRRRSDDTFAMKLQRMGHPFVVADEHLQNLKIFASGVQRVWCLGASMKIR